MPGMFEHPIHVPIVKARLMRNFDLGAIFPEMCGEISAGFEDLVPPSDGDNQACLVLRCLHWLCYLHIQNGKQFPQLTLYKVFFVGQATGYLLGCPYVSLDVPCTGEMTHESHTGRNQEYIRINIDRARNIFFASVTLKFVPEFLKPYVLWLVYAFVKLTCMIPTSGCRFVVRLFGNLSQGVARGTSILSPLIEERRRITQSKNTNDELKPVRWPPQPSWCRLLCIHLERLLTMDDGKGRRPSLNKGVPCP